MASASRAAIAPDPSVSKRKRPDRFRCGFLSLGTAREGRGQAEPRILIPLSTSSNARRGLSRNRDVLNDITNVNLPAVDADRPS